MVRLGASDVDPYPDLAELLHCIIWNELIRHRINRWWLFRGGSHAGYFGTDTLGRRCSDSVGRWLVRYRSHGPLRLVPRVNTARASSDEREYLLLVRCFI